MKKVYVSVRTERLIDLLDDEEGGKLYPQITGEATVLEAIAEGIQVTFVIGEEEN